MKRKWLAIGIILLFVGSCIIPVFAQHNEKPLPTSRGNWLYVGGSGPGNYTKIKDAINEANSGDTVFVYSGTYYENIDISTDYITLLGENRETTIIDGGGTGYNVLGHYANGLKVSGFTLQNGTYGILFFVCGNNVVTNIDISKNILVGFSLEYSNNNTIVDNIISNEQYGISLITYCSSNIITGNTLSNNTFGIELFSFSDNNKITGNILSNNYVSIYIGYSSNNNILFHNNFINNTQNAYDFCSNIWNDGYPAGGNYWSNYTGLDSNGDGIGDTPYNISGGSNQDHYPFIRQNEWSNKPPATPTITGPAEGKIKVSTMYNFTTTDPDDDTISYFIEWDDGTNSSWIGPYSSGDVINKSHTWSKKGDYTIKAKVKDSHGNESDWSQFSVTMPYKPPQFLLLEWLIDRFPNIFPILRNLMGY